MPSVCAILPSAGIGTRMGGTLKKQYTCLNNKPILVHTIERLTKSNLIDDIIIVVPKKDIKFCEEEVIKPYNLSNVKNIIVGGENRQDSVNNALVYLPLKNDFIMVHDGVRPIISKEILKKSINMAIKFGAVVTAVPEKDTVKEISSDEFILKTLDREKIWRIQTPQVFRKDILVEAYKNAYKVGFRGTDDASLVERIGVPIKIIKGSYLNIKITFPEDIIMGECFLGLCKK